MVDVLRRGSPVRGPVVVAAVCAVLAVAARALIVRSQGGLLALGNYDDSVYFGSALALVHGRLPYRDFLLVQPPGITLILTPFAALAGVIGEAHAWAVARVAFVLVGGANAAAGALALRRSGTGAALLGGLWIALAYQTADVDRSTLLEGVGTLGVLVALVLLRGGSSTRGQGSRRTRVVAGVALGVAVSVKIFFLLPLVVLAVALGRRALPLVAGAAGALLVVLLPFFVAAPVAMWRQVVLDQLGRPRIGTDLSRFRGVLQPAPLPGLPPVVVVAVAAVLAVVLLVAALLDREARVLAVLAIAATALLLAAPSFYRHYAVLAAVPFGLTAGVVLGPRLQRALGGGRVPRAGAVLVSAALVAWLVGGWSGTGATVETGVHAPRGLAAAVRAVPGCTTTLTPGLLILSGTFGLQIERGCPIRVDPTGEVYDRDFAGAVPPSQNPRWQRDGTAYLRSGSAMLLRREGRWFDAANLAELHRLPLVFAGGRAQLRLTRAAG